MDYLCAGTLDEALGLLAQTRMEVICGGTDLYATSSRRPGADLVDISRIEALCGVNVTDGALRIGAATTWTSIRRMNGVLPQALVEVAGLIGSPQIQQRATIGGNLCHAAAAADGIPVLLALDATVELASQGGKRAMPLSRFLVGRRRTALADGELMTAVSLPAPRVNEGTAYVKIGNRTTITIAVLSAAVRLRWDAGGRVTDAAVAVGAASEIAHRMPAIESRLLGVTLDALDDVPLDIDLCQQLSPITDLRATAEYRRQMVSTTIRRACAQIRIGAKHG
jgi:CO/xanthine dehydrogenase FAD-binding subunit